MSFSESPAMSAMSEPLREVDLGPDGITGAYEKFVSHLGRGLSDGVIAAGAWLYLGELSPAIDYQLTPSLSAVLLVKIALLLWSVWIAWTLLRAVLNGTRWLSLESKGMQWARDGDGLRRVTFYRASDKILRCDETEPSRCAREDKAGSAYRRRALLWDGVWLAIFAAGYFYLLQGFDYARAWIGPGLQAAIDRWDGPWLARLVLLVFGIVPRAVDVLMVLLESIVHAAGAQFMPGAKMREP
jgi:hypothetical protein